MLEVEHGVGVVDRGAEQPVGVLDGPGHTTLSPAVPTNQPSGEPAWNGPPRTPPPVGQRIVIGIGWPERQCVFAATVTIGSNGAGDEVGELELDDRPLAHPGGADRGADEPLLGDRRVDHPLLAELLEQPRGDAEGAAERADVLAEQEDAVVLAHRVAAARRGSPRGR